MPTRRNPVVRYGALLRKGGAHTESVSGARHQSKRQLDDEIDDYFNQHRDDGLSIGQPPGTQKTTNSKNPPKHTRKGRSSSAPSALWRLCFYRHQACTQSAPSHPVFAYR